MEYSLHCACGIHILSTNYRSGDNKHPYPGGNGCIHATHRKLGVTAGNNYHGNHRAPLIATTSRIPTHINTGISIITTRNVLVVCTCMTSDHSTITRSDDLGM